MQACCQTEAKPSRLEMQELSKVPPGCGCPPAEFLTKSRLLCRRIVTKNETRLPRSAVKDEEERSREFRLNPWGAGKIKRQVGSVTQKP
jgi:hypothetical protein